MDSRLVAMASALRDLLEVALCVQLHLDGDAPKRERTMSGDLDGALVAAAVALEPYDEALRTWAVRNLTAHEVMLKGCDGVDWIVPAFGSRSMHRDPRQQFELDVAEGRGEIVVIDPPGAEDARQPRNSRLLCLPRAVFDCGTHHLGRSLRMGTRCVLTRLADGRVHRAKMVEGT